MNDVADAVCRCGADTVAVLSSGEIDGVTLRHLAWELEKTGTDCASHPRRWTWDTRRITIPPDGFL